MNGAEFRAGMCGLFIDNPTSADHDITAWAVTNHES
jgi:hypothetical protein